MILTELVVLCILQVVTHVFFLLLERRNVKQQNVEVDCLNFLILKLRIDLVLLLLTHGQTKRLDNAAQVVKSDA